MQFALNKQNIIDLINKFTPDVTNQFSSNIANAYIQGSETEKKFFGEIEDYLEQNKFNIKKVTTDNNLKILITPEFLASIAMLTSQSTIGDQFYRYGINEDPTNTFFKDFYAAGFKPSEGITIIDPSKNATTIMKTVEEQFTYLVNNDKPLKATIKFSKHGHDGYKTDIDFSNDFKDEFPSESEDNQQQIAEALAFQAIGPLLSINSDPEHISINMNNVSDNLKTEILLACQRLCGLYGVTFKSPENQENVNFLQEEQTKLLVNHIEEESPQTIFLFPAVKDFDKDLYQLETDILYVDVAQMNDDNLLNRYETLSNNYNKTIQLYCGPHSQQKITTRLANLKLILKLQKTIQDNVAQVNQILKALPDPNAQSDNFNTKLTNIVTEFQSSMKAITDANHNTLDTHTLAAIARWHRYYFQEHITDTSTMVLKKVKAALKNATAEACTNNGELDTFLATVQSMVEYTGEEPLGKFTEFTLDRRKFSLLHSDLKAIKALADRLSNLSDKNQQQLQELKQALEQELLRFNPTLSSNLRYQIIPALINNLLFRCDKELVDVSQEEYEDPSPDLFRMSKEFAAANNINIDKEALILIIPWFSELAVLLRLINISSLPNSPLSEIQNAIQDKLSQFQALESNIQTLPIMSERYAIILRSNDIVEQMINEIGNNSDMNVLWGQEPAITNELEDWKKHCAAVECVQECGNSIESGDIETVFEFLKARAQKDQGYSAQPLQIKITSDVVQQNLEILDALLKKFNDPKQFSVTIADDLLKSFKKQEAIRVINNSDPCKPVIITLDMINQIKCYQPSNSSEESDQAGNETAGKKKELLEYLVMYCQLLGCYFTVNEDVLNHCDTTMKELLNNCNSESLEYRKWFKQFSLPASMRDVLTPGELHYWCTLMQDCTDQYNIKSFSSEYRKWFKTFFSLPENKRELDSGFTLSQLDIAIPNDSPVMHQGIRSLQRDQYRELNIHAQDTAYLAQIENDSKSSDTEDLDNAKDIADLAQIENYISELRQILPWLPNQHLIQEIQEALEAKKNKLIIRIEEALEATKYQLSDEQSSKPTVNPHPHAPEQAQVQGNLEQPQPQAQEQDRAQEQEREKERARGQQRVWQTREKAGLLLVDGNNLIKECFNTSRYDNSFYPSFDDFVAHNHTIAIDLLCKKCEAFTEQHLDSFREGQDVLVRKFESHLDRIGDFVQEQQQICLQEIARPSPVQQDYNDLLVYLQEIKGKTLPEWRAFLNAFQDPFYRNDYTDRLNDYTDRLNDYTDRLNDYTDRLRACVDEFKQKKLQEFVSKEILPTHRGILQEFKNFKSQCQDYQRQYTVPILDDILDDIIPTQIPGYMREYFFEDAISVYSKLLNLRDQQKQLFNEVPEDVKSSVVHELLDEDDDTNSPHELVAILKSIQPQDGEDGLLVKFYRDYIKKLLDKSKELGGSNSALNNNYKLITERLVTLQDNIQTSQLTSRVEELKFCKEVQETIQYIVFQLSILQLLDDIQKLRADIAAVSNEYNSDTFRETRNKITKRLDGIEDACNSVISMSFDMIRTLDHVSQAERILLLFEEYFNSVQNEIGAIREVYKLLIDQRIDYSKIESILKDLTHMSNMFKCWNSITHEHASTLPAPDLGKEAKSQCIYIKQKMRLQLSTQSPAASSAPDTGKEAKSKRKYLPELQLSPQLRSQNKQRGGSPAASSAPDTGKEAKSQCK